MVIRSQPFWNSFMKDVDAGRLAAFRENVIECFYRLVLFEGDVAIDIGAHRARHTAPMAEMVGPSGKVHAVEAASAMQQKLRAKINRSDVPSIRSIVQYHDCALSNETGTAQFYYYPVHGSGLSSLVARSDDPSGKRELEVEEVSVCRLDSIISPATPVRFIKADIEGAEYHAFMGGKELLQTARPLMAFEHGAQSDADRFNYSKDDFFGLFAELGYDLITVFGRRYGPDSWGARDAHDLFAIPKEESDEGGELVSLAILGAIEATLKDQASER